MPKMPKSTIFSKSAILALFDTLVKNGVDFGPPKNQRSENVLRRTKGKWPKPVKKVSKMTPKMTPKTPFRPLFYTLFSKSPLEKRMKMAKRWSKSAKKVKKSEKKGKKVTFLGSQK